MKKKREYHSLKKTQLFLALIFGFFLTIQAQNKSEFWQHVGIGGGLGLSFGSDFFGVTVAPSAIYQFNTQFALGLGLNYSYNESQDFYTSSIFGGSIIGLYNPIRALQLSAEFEQLNVHRNYDSSAPYIDENYWYPALFLGIGYSAGPVTIGMRFDVLFDSDRSIYANPWGPFLRFYF